MATGVRITGLRPARDYLGALEEATRDADRATVKVGSPLGYAYGIETGVHRSGRRARAAGGVFYLTRAYQAEQGNLTRRLSRALKDGGSLLDELKRTGLDMERRAKSLVVVVSGTLRRSIQTIYPGRPVTMFTPTRTAPSTRRTVRPR